MKNVSSGRRPNDNESSGTPVTAEAIPSRRQLLWWLFVLSLFLGFLGDLQRVGWDTGLLFWLTVNGALMAMLVFWAIIVPAKRLIDRITAWQYKPFRKLVCNIIVSALGATAVLIAELEFFVYLFADPENDPRQNFHDLLFAFLIAAIAAAIYNVSDFFRAWKQDLLRNEVLERQKALAQLEALKSQLNPHFLFNSLNTLSSLTLRDPQKARESIRQLAKVYRYVLENRQIDLVPLRHELDFLQTYIDLLETRFGTAIQVTVADQDNGNLFVAPLVLQVLVENAVKHNIVSVKKPLQVAIRIEDGWLVVENNLQLKSTRPYSSGLGIEGIVARYRYISDSSISVSQEEGLFIVKVPLILQADISNTLLKYEGRDY